MGLINNLSFVEVSCAAIILPVIPVFVRWHCSSMDNLSFIMQR